MSGSNLDFEIMLPETALAVFRSAVGEDAVSDWRVVAVASGVLKKDHSEYMFRLAELLFLARLGPLGLPRGAELEELELEMEEEEPGIVERIRLRFDQLLGPAGEREYSTDELLRSVGGLPNSLEPQQAEEPETRAAEEPKDPGAGYRSLEEAGIQYQRRSGWPGPHTTVAIVGKPAHEPYTWREGNPLKIESGSLVVPPHYARELRALAAQLEGQAAEALSGATAKKPAHRLVAVRLGSIHSKAERLGVLVTNVQPGGSLMSFDEVVEGEGQYKP